MMKTMIFADQLLIVDVTPTKSAVEACEGDNDAEPTKQGTGPGASEKAGEHEKELRRIFESELLDITNIESTSKGKNRVPLRAKLFAVLRNHVRKDSLAETVKAVKMKCNVEITRSQVASYVKNARDASLHSPRGC